MILWNSSPLLHCIPAFYCWYLLIWNCVGFPWPGSDVIVLPLSLTCRDWWSTIPCNKVQLQYVTKSVTHPFPHSDQEAAWATAEGIWPWQTRAKAWDLRHWESIRLAVPLTFRYFSYFWSPGKSKTSRPLVATATVLFLKFVMFGSLFTSWRTCLCISCLILDGLNDRLCGIAAFERFLPISTTDVCRVKTGFLFNLRQPMQLEPRPKWPSTSASSPNVAKVWDSKLLQLAGVLRRASLVSSRHPVFYGHLDTLAYVAKTITAKMLPFDVLV